MMHDRDTTPKPGLFGTRLMVQCLGALALASCAVLATGAVSWWILHAVGREAEALHAGGGDAAAMLDGILLRLDGAWLALAVCIVAGIAVLAGVCLYFVRAVVRPLQTDARIMSRLAVGDSSVDAPAPQLARDDEIGDLARAIRDMIAYQREEAAIANAMSAGNFTGAVAARDPADTLGQAIRKMACITVDTLGFVDAHARQVMAGCEAIASAGGKLSSNRAGVAGAVTEMVDGIDRIRTHADDNANAAERAGRLAGAGSQSIDRGYEDIGEMGVVMLSMQSCGDKIVGIAKSIGDIAFQTNLLALNASVEAARAGRHGKGFTIVAEEVRNLAVRTRKAAEETSTLMKETVEQVELAAGIAGRINATFGEMQTNIQEADTLLAKIVDASREQAGGIGRLSDVMHRVDRSAREDREHIDDILEKAGRLVGQTGRMRQAIGRFRVDYRQLPDAGQSAMPAEEYDAGFSIVNRQIPGDKSTFSAATARRE